MRQGYCCTCLAIRGGGYFGRVTKAGADSSAEKSSETITSGRLILYTSSSGSALVDNSAPAVYKIQGP